MWQISHIWSQCHNVLAELKIEYILSEEEGLFKGLKIFHF